MRGLSTARRCCSAGTVRVFKPRRKIGVVDGRWPKIGHVPSIQTSDEIRAMLTRLEGRRIATLQVLGINSLKSMLPGPDALTGEIVEAATISHRLIKVSTEAHDVVFDLQRTGRAFWLASASLYAPDSGSPRPTVRLVLADGSAMDLREPAKTKRITVTIAVRS